MPALREIIARFRLDSKPEDFKTIDKAVNNTKNGLKSLASAFGLSMGIAGTVAIARTGLAADRAQFQLKRLAGTNFAPLREQFQNVQRELDTIRAGASNIVRPRQFDEAAAEFTRAFGSGEQQTKAFGKIFSFASKQAALTGKDVVEVVKDIQQGILGGGFENLQDIPGFDVFKKKMLEFQQDIINPNEPGGRVAIQNRMRALMDIMTKAEPGQNSAIKQLPANLLTADEVGNKLQDTLEKMGKIITDLLVPALEKMLEILGYIQETMFETQRIAAKSGASVPETFVGRSLANTFTGGKASDESVIASSSWVKKTLENPISEIKRGFSGMADPERWSHFFGIKTPKDRERERQEKDMANNNVVYNNTFNITSTDPMQAAQEAKREFSDTVREARSSLIQTESR